MARTAFEVTHSVEGREHSGPGTTAAPSERTDCTADSVCLDCQIIVSGITLLVATVAQGPVVLFIEEPETKKAAGNAIEGQP